MTMPHERTRSLMDAVEFLRELQCLDDLPKGVRDQLVGILRHLPEARAIELEAKRQLHRQEKNGESSWLLPTNYYDLPRSSHPQVSGL